MEFIVTDAPRAKIPPTTVASALAVIETAARMFPTKSQPGPRVALVPIFQKTLAGCPPPMISTVDPIAVVRVLPIWKYHASSALPVPSRVKTPLNCADEGYA